MIYSQFCISDLSSRMMLEFEGAVSALDEETMCPSSHLTTPVTDATSGEGQFPLAMSELGFYFLQPLNLAFYLLLSRRYQFFSRMEHSYL